ncbi:MAG: HAD hydrolase family protein [Eubacteriales bacterium]|nr:HAD hydrolase family protein [Eubacteriales bacterium]
MNYQKKRKIQIPGIGMRIIKSAVAILICYMVNILRGGHGMVFYSQLAALWCVQMYRSNTKKNAIQRTIGTVIGACYGLLYLLIYPKLIYPCQNVEVAEAFVISVAIVLVLYTTVILKKQQSSYFSCVVFLSIVVNHVSDGNPYLFVWNRFLDTMIGIVVGITVNDVRLCLHPDRNTLFISGLDDTLLNKEEVLSAFSKVELNRMIDNGMRFTVSTMRTPAALLEPMRDIRLKWPVIAMDGAVLYDTQKHSYLRVYVISSKTSQRLMQRMIEENICWYANVIIDDLLVIYYGEMVDRTNLNMIEELRTSPFRNYVRRPLPQNEDVTYFMLLDQVDKIAFFYEILKQEGYTNELKIITYPSQDYPGYAYIKIYNKNATKENMIRYLKEMTNSENVVTFGTIPGQYDVLIHEDNANEVVRKVRKMYEPMIVKTKSVK